MTFGTNETGKYVVELSDEFNSHNASYYVRNLFYSNFCSVVLVYVIMLHFGSYRWIVMMVRKSCCFFNRGFDVAHWLLAKCKVFQITAKLLNSNMIQVMITWMKRI